MAYCDKTDLLTGDIRLAGKYGDGTAFVNMAADEIDSQIGHIYVTPIVFDESTPQKAAKSRPAKLLLKRINTLLASGRIILDMAAGGEDRDLHAYGASMRDEALLLLKQLSDGLIVIPDVETIDPEVEDPDATTGPSMVHEDPISLVEMFYYRFPNGCALPFGAAYGNRVAPINYGNEQW